MNSVKGRTWRLYSGLVHTPTPLFDVKVITLERHYLRFHVLEDAALELLDVERWIRN